MRPRNLLIVALVLAAGVVALVIVLSGGGPSGRQTGLAGLAATVVPGASVALVPSAQGTAGEQELKIVLPDSVLPPTTAASPQNDSTAAATYAAAGWRGALIAAITATRVPGLTNFVTTDKQEARPAAAAFYLDGSVRTMPGQNPAPGMTRLDQIPGTAARKQLDDNLAVLMRGLPAGSVTRASVTRISVDPAHRRSAFAVELRVKDLQSLSRYFGDLFGGLATGLAPGQASTVEGLSIHAVDDAGRNAGSWMATRAQQGTTVMDSHLHAPAVLEPHLPFVNETGGPAAPASAHAGTIH